MPTVRAIIVSSLIVKIAQFRRIFWQIPSWCGGITLPRTPGSNHTECLLLRLRTPLPLLKVQLCSHLKHISTHWDPIMASVSPHPLQRHQRIDPLSSHQELYSSSRLFFSFSLILFCFSINN